MPKGGADGLAPDLTPSQAAAGRAILKLLAAAPATPLAQQVTAFYTARGFKPVWTGSDKAAARAVPVRFVLSHAARQGLRSADYPLAAKGAQPGTDPVVDDVTLTTSLFEYAQDVRDGRVAPGAVYNDVKLPARDFDPGPALAAALKDDKLNSFLAALPPPHPQYKRLVAALAHYHAIAARGGWQTLSAKKLTPARLAKRLALEDGALAANAHPSAADVRKALMRFQERHGLKADGNVGSATLKALNEPVSDRIGQIDANMERWRWMPRAFAKTYIRVDVPEQSVEFVRDGKVVLHSRAVIGRPDNTTPILVTRVEAVIANPYWDIPDDISIQALVPHLRHNANYLKTRDMVLVNGPPGDPYGAKIDWRKVTGDALPYQIREEPGPHNALGKIMLDMPNEFYVYLHDTPARHLFTLEDRDRSHGCVRVQKIGKLAELVLAGTDAKPDKALTAALKTKKTQRLALPEPLPVYMDYWTASAEANGTVVFRSDIYDRDKPLIARLAGEVAPPKPTLRSAALASADGDIGP